MIKFMINSLRIKERLQKGRSTFHNLFHLKPGYRHLEVSRRTRMLKPLYYLRFRVIKRNFYKRDTFMVCGDDSYELRELKTNGIVVIPNYLDSDKVEIYLEKIRGHAYELVSSIGGPVDSSLMEVYEKENEYYYAPNMGLLRVLNLKELGELQCFYESDVVETCFSPLLRRDKSSLKPFSVRYEYSWGSETESVADSWHFDDWQPRLKAFLYLNNVDQWNSPFQYISGSHTLRHRQRNWREFDYYYHGNNYLEGGNFGYCIPGWVDELVERYQLEKRSYKVKAGTLVLVDTRGIHRRTIPKGGERFILAAYFV